MDKKILLKQLLEYFYKGEEIPDDLTKMRKMYKDYVSSCTDLDIPEDILTLEDKYLRLELINKKLLDGEKYNPINVNLDNKYHYGDLIALYQGDIGSIYADVIINPVDEDFNNKMFINAGLRLKKKCLDILDGKKLAPTEILITRAYNLLSDFVIHVVKPVSDGEFDYKTELSMCYHNVLECSNNNIAKVVVLSDIADHRTITKEEAMDILINTIMEYFDRNECKLEKVIIVAKDDDTFDEYVDIFEKYKETTE